jgi:hypothetical protein
MKTFGLVVAATLGLLAYPAMAEIGIIDGLEIARACAGDVLRLCGGVTPGDGRVKACVRQNMANLSTSCHDAIQQDISAAVPQDGAQATVKRFTNLNNYRYCEVFLIGGNPFDLEGAVYNTTDLNNAADPRDSCSAGMWSKVDAKALKDEFHVLGVFKNGPRFWMYDWAELPVGAQHSFDGLRARWFAQVKLPPNILERGSTFYKPTTVERKSKQGYAKGQTIFILDDPESTPWIMQAYSLIVDPDLKYDDLKTLNTKLKLPPGWKYRFKVLDRDLEVHAINGTARIVQDDLEGTYNACFVQGGESACTYQP